MKRFRLSFFQPHRFGHDYLDKAASVAKTHEIPPLVGDYTPLYRATRHMKNAFRLSESNAFRVLPSADMFSQSASYFLKISEEFLSNLPSNATPIPSSEGDKQNKKDISTPTTKDKKSQTSTDNNPLLSLAPDQEHRIKIGLRLYLAGQYFQSLHTLVKQQPEILSRVDANLNIAQLIDAAVLGSSSERAEAHIKLFGPDISEETLQVSLYALYDCEVLSARTLLTLYPLTKPLQKRVTKLADSFLVDQVELNTKNRCIYSWSSPAQGKSGLPPATLPIGTVLYGRQQFFKESDQIAARFVQQLQRQERERDDDDAEMQGYKRKGLWFMLVTIALDWIICSM